MRAACFVLAAFLISADVLAIPAPASEEYLADMSDLVVEGLVVAATYVGKRTSGDYQVASYRGELQVTRVLKGKLRPGSVLTILWETELWIGKGEQPDGRAPQPYYLACQMVRTHLRAQPKNTYVTTEWNGRRQLEPQPPGSPWPSARQPTVRCVKGKVIIPPRGPR